MKLLLVHPGPLMYTKVYLRLEPLGLELVAEAARRAGHEVALLDLQIDTHRDYLARVASWEPDAVGVSCNYLANVPEIVDLAKLTKAQRPNTFFFVGGHSASFIAGDLLRHADGAIDCVVKGEGEPSVGPLLDALLDDARAVSSVPGVVSADGEGPRPHLCPI